MERVDQMVMHICPFFAGIVLVGSVYWTAVTYGAVSVMQVLGHSDGLRFMERMDPMMLLVGLPCIPLVLVAAKMVRWEEALVRLLLFRRVSSSLQRTLLGCFAFVVLKGLTKLIYHQKKWLFVTDRRVLNHPDGTDEDT
uniref:TLC domain-containing protein n=1 Tax=Macrostomum lignano TaxID=282301 RepID=A0A1I8HCL4_9PLAT